MQRSTISRRHFLKSSFLSGAWVLSLNLPMAAQAKTKQPSTTGWSLYVRVHKNNQVTMESPVMEMGQFMRTTGPMMFAEEMDLDWQSITFIRDTRLHLKRDDEGKIDFRYVKANTGGSHSVRWTWEYLRKAGAAARQMLIQEASEKLGVPIEELSTTRNTVVHSKTGRTITYGDLAEGASQRQINESQITLKNKNAFSIIGTDKRNIDLKDIVTGKPLFGIDAEYPNCKQAVIARAPAIGAQIASYDKKAALAVPGVQQVVEMSSQEETHWFNGNVQILAAGIAVVADNLWAAMKGKAALNATWKNTHDAAKENSEERIKKFYDLVTDDSPAERSKDVGNVDEAFSNADFTVERIYEKPLHAHALMEPFNCIADIRDDSATIITGHQNPKAIAEEAEKYAGIDALKVEVISKRMGGGFGRRYERDFVREAILLSKKIAQPVKVTWMREDEIERGMHDPACVARVKAGVKDGKITSWFYRQAQTKAGIQDSCFPEGLFENFRVERCSNETFIPAGPWRGPQHPAWAFANESMIDEIAYKLDKDPLEFRLDLLLPARELPYTNWGATIKDSGRMAICFQEAAKMADWKRKRPKGRGIGIAGHVCHGSYAAFVIEVSVIDERLQLHEAWGAIDCGLAINPNHIRSQMEGGFIDGLNAALFNKVKVEDGKVTNNQFGLLRMGKLEDAPIEVHTTIISNDHEPTGVGEPPTAPAAAALANAIFAASGKRLYRQPFAESFQV